MSRHTPIFFNQILISMNLNQHAKNKAFSSFCSIDIVDLRILQSDWLEPIFQEPDFSQTCDFPKYTAININFHCTVYQIQKELISKFSYTFKEPYVWPHFPHFGDKKHYFQKISSVMHNTAWAPSTMLSSRKTKEPVPYS